MRATVLCAALLMATNGLAAGPAPKSSVWEYDFHSVVPLGADALRLVPTKKTVYLLASAESPAFEGLKRTARGDKTVVIGPDGELVQDYPQALDFRVTASAKKKKVTDEDLEPYPVRAYGELNDYLLKLGFRVKIFHGIDVRVLEPSEVKLIGVPGDVPYDERVYRVSFQLEKVPLADRIVLEVLDPRGDRISKFHLEVF
jgi:hypothetical protein